MNQTKFNEVISQFKNTKDKYDAVLSMNEFLIYDKGTLFKHNFKDTIKKSDIRSISKTVITLILGILIDNSKSGLYKDINEDTLVYPIIKDKFTLTNHDNLDFLKKIKIKHLLTHTIGFEDVLMMRGDIEDTTSTSLLDSILNHAIVHEPGSFYLYSNAGFYLLSVVIETLSNEPFLDYADRVFFSKLNITDYEWEKYGDYCAGATRLWLHGEDLVKIGILLLKQGIYRDQKILSNIWIETMTRPLIETPGVDTPERYFRRYAYGYGIWLGHQDYFFGHGTDGQILLVLPKENKVIVTLAEQNDITPIEIIVDEISNYNN